MRLLFDEDTPEQLMRHFQPHITADSNLYHQQFVAGFDITVVVLRAWRTRLEFLLPAVPAALQTLESIQPGEVRYHYADELSEQKDRRKGKGPFRKS